MRIIDMNWRTALVMRMSLHTRMDVIDNLLTFAKDSFKFDLEAEKKQINLWLDGEPIQ